MCSHCFISSRRNFETAMRMSEQFKLRIAIDKEPADEFPVVRAAGKPAARPEH